MKSLVLQNVTFTNVEKIVFEPFVSVEETDDGVNFGKSVVRIKVEKPIDINSINKLYILLRSTLL